MCGVSFLVLQNDAGGVKGVLLCWPICQSLLLLTVLSKNSLHNMIILYILIIVSYDTENVLFVPGNKFFSMFTIQYTNLSFTNTRKLIQN